MVRARGGEVPFGGVAFGTHAPLQQVNKFGHTFAVDLGIILGGHLTGLDPVVAQRRANLQRREF